MGPGFPPGQREQKLPIFDLDLDSCPASQRNPPSVFTAGTAGYPRLPPDFYRPTRARGAGRRATGHTPAVRCARPRRARSHRAQRPPEPRATPAGHPRSCATTTDRSRDVSAGRWKGAAAAIVERREATTDEARGRSDPTALQPSAAGPQDRARAARDWGCRAAGSWDYQSFPRRNAHARRARQKGSGSTD
jgi:hypothetical protein